MTFNTDKKVIVMADDDMDDTEMFCEALEDINEDIICHCAVNGKDALAIIDKLDKKTQLIFLDLNMPIMDGWECLKVLKSEEKYKDIPVIMISTSSHKMDIENALNLGAICYFVKPNNFTELKDVLHTITSNLGAGLKEAIFKLQASSENIFAF